MGKVRAIYLMPGEFKPWWAYSEEDRQDRATKLGRGKSVFMKVGKVTVYITKVGTDWVIWAANKGVLIYEVQIKHPQFKSGKIVMQVPYQCSVWRDEEFAETTQIPKKVFWEIYKDKKIIVSDIEQSADGRRFWQHRVVDALQMGLNVYLCKHSHTHPDRRILVSLVKLRKEADLNMAYSKDVEKGSSSFLAISGFPL